MAPNKVLDQPSVEMGLGDFEKRVAKVFERKGYGYTGLMELSAREMERVHGQMLVGELSFAEAVGNLLETFRLLKEQGS